MRVSKLTQSSVRLLGLLACLAMLLNPVVHAQLLASVSGDWILLCTGKGVTYVNINPDNNDEPPEDIEQLRGSPCCVYDVVPEVVATVFKKTQSTYFSYEAPAQYFPFSDYSTYYFSRAPPVFS